MLVGLPDVVLVTGVWLWTVALYLCLIPERAIGDFEHRKIDFASTLKYNLREMISKQNIFCNNNPSVIITAQFYPCPLTNSSSCTARPLHTCSHLSLSLSLSLNLPLSHSQPLHSQPPSLSLSLSLSQPLSLAQNLFRMYDEHVFSATIRPEMYLRMRLRFVS